MWRERVGRWRLSELGGYRGGGKERGSEGKRSMN